MPNELKPCPFCGGSDQLSIELEPITWAGYCDNCCSYGPQEITKERAIDAWNQRTPDAVDNIGAKGEGQMTDVGKLKEWLIYQNSNRGLAQGDADDLDQILSILDQYETQAKRIEDLGEELKKRTEALERIANTDDTVTVGIMRQYARYVITPKPDKEK